MLIAKFKFTKFITLTLITRLVINHASNTRRHATPVPILTSTSTPGHQVSPAPNLDLLQLAASAAGIADDDGSTTYSVESLSLPFDYSTPSPPGTPISEPNRSLLGLSTASNMPKNKNKGVQGDTPTKSPRKEGRRSVQINYSHYSKKGAETGLLGMARIPYLAPRCSSRTVVIVMGIFSNNTYYHTYLTTVIPICHTATSEEDDLDMSVIQEGNGSVHSSELDSTIQSDPIPPKGAQGPAPGPAPPPAGKTYGPRQSTPNRDTPKSTHPEEDTEKDSDESSSSESDAGDEEEDDLDADALAQ